MRRWIRRLIHDPTASADAVTETPLSGLRRDERSRGVSREPRGYRFASAATAEAVTSRVRRLSHHHMATTWYWDSLLMLKHRHPAHQDTCSASDASSRRMLRAVPAKALAITVFLLRCRLRRSAHGPGDYPTTT